ncbi:MAG TPA: DUF5985 family protein [Planctomycetaceae bacterium]|nr:DUF5985 family protein [Planctomycetaceae bacterium]
MTGALAMGFGILGSFFFRFWRQTRDQLFGFFALAFFIMAVSRLWLAFVTPGDTHGEYPYWLRLISFAMILVAILNKNLVRKTA